MDKKDLVEILKNGVKAIQPVRCLINDRRLAKGLNGIASLRITPSKIKRFIEYLNNTYPDFHITFLDVGARGGLADSRFEPLRHVQRKTLHAIEPYKEAAEALMQSKEYDTVYTDAVGLTNGIATLYIPEKWPACSSIVEQNTASLKQMDPTWASWYQWTTTQPIQTKTLDTICGPNASYNFIKLDTEGIEYDILNSLEEHWFQNLTCLVVLVTAFQVFKNQHTMGDLYNLMATHNFYPLKHQFYGLFGSLDGAGHVTFIKGPWMINTLEDVLKHCLVGMIMQKPYYVSYILNRFRKLFPSDALYKAIWKYV